MDIGIPRERKIQEGRVALTPVACRSLLADGQRVRVEQGAGLASGYSDADYQQAGCEIVSDNSALYERSQLIVKVKEPIAEDLAQLRPHHTLFCYLHLAAEPALLSHLLDIGLKAYAFETLMVDGRLPLLAPMSMVAGRLAIQLGMHYLERAQGGAGVLLGGVTGTPAGRVVVLGAGVAGGHAALRAAALGAEVVVFDRTPAALTRLQAEDARLQTHLVDPDHIVSALESADLLVGAVLLPGATAPRVVSSDMLAYLPAGRVVVDIAIDQGGCIEGMRATSWAQPAYQDAAGHILIGVTNLPGAVPRTSSQALSQAILPYVQALASGQGLQDSLASALALEAGQRRHPALIAMATSKSQS